MRYKQSVPTVYKNTQFRSRFEARVAYWLDSKKIKWEYEGKSFLLKNGTMIWPDFYLPELKTWLEVKGNLKSSDLTDFKHFAWEFKTEAILITPNREVWFTGIGYEEMHGEASQEELCLSKCPSCGKYYFCGILGGYNCRFCNFHPGGHLDFGEEDIINNIRSILKKPILAEVYDS